MTLTQTVWTFARSGRFDRLVAFFFPVRRIHGQWFIFRPYWHNGNFAMRSINRARF